MAPKMVPKVKDVVDTLTDKKGGGGGGKGGGGSKRKEETTFARSVRQTTLKFGVCPREKERERERKTESAHTRGREGESV